MREVCIQPATCNLRTSTVHGQQTEWTRRNGSAGDSGMDVEHGSSWSTATISTSSAPSPGTPHCSCVRECEANLQPAHLYRARAWEERTWGNGSAEWTMSTALCNIYTWIVFYTIFFFYIVVLQCRTALQLDAGCGVLHRNGWPIPSVWQLGGAATVLQARSWLPKREEREAFPVGGYPHNTAASHWTSR